MSTTPFPPKRTKPFYPLLLCFLPRPLKMRKLLNDKEVGVKKIDPKLIFLNIHNLKKA